MDRSLKITTYLQSTISYHLLHFTCTCLHQIASISSFKSETLILFFGPNSLSIFIDKGSVQNIPQFSDTCYIFDTFIGYVSDV